MHARTTAQPWSSPHVIKVFKTVCFQFSLHHKTMATPHDRESLLAAWEAIGPSQPLPNEIQGWCLAYFKNLQQHGHHESSIVLTPQIDEEFTLPPTRYVRQPRANKRYPTGPVRAECYPIQSTESWISESLTSATCTTANHHVGLSANSPDQVADGPNEDQVLPRSF